MSNEITRKVEEIAGRNEYVQRTLSIENRAHRCSWDSQGRCLYCPARSGIGSALMPNGRTGELETK